MQDGPDTSAGNSPDLSILWTIQGPALLDGAEVLEDPAEPNPLRGSFFCCSVTRELMVSKFRGWP